MVSTFTTNFALEKPGNGDSNWGTAWNANADTIDAELSSTLDDAYDEGGAGIGRAITVDAGAVVLSATADNTALDISQTTAATTTVLAVLNSGTGDAIQITQDGAGIGLEVNKTNVAGGVCVNINNSGTGDAIQINQDSNAITMDINKTNTGSATVVDIDNGGTGVGLFLRSTNTNSAASVVTVTNSGTGDGVFINQDGNGVALDIDSEATGQPLVQLAPINTNTRGDISFGTARTGNPSSPSEGDVWYNSTDNNLYLFDGVTNVDLTAAGGGGGTLDDAYDEGGAGVGRTITVDSDAIQLNVTADNTALDINQTTAATTNVLDILNSGTGDAIFIDSDGAGRGIDIVQNGAENAINLIQNGNATALNITVADNTSRGFRVNKIGTGGNPVIEVVNSGSGNGLSISSSGSAPAIHVQNTSDETIRITSGTSSLAAIHFGDSGDEDIGRIVYDHLTNSLDFFTDNLERVNIDSAGDLNVLNDLVVTGSATISGKLTVTGGVDPDYMQLTPQVAYDHIPKGSLFVDANDDDKLKFLHEDGVSVYEVNVTPSQFGAA